MATAQSTQKSAIQKSAAKEPPSNMQLPADVLEGVYTTMCRIRRFDEMTHKLFDEGHVKGTAHSYVGQEAIAASVGANLREDDYMASNPRCLTPEQIEDLERSFPRD